MKLDDICLHCEMNTLYATNDKIVVNNNHEYLSEI